MLAVIGGTGLYAIDGVTIRQRHTVTTPFGMPSAAIIEATVENTPLLFLPRHGEGHALLPHEINYCANIFALKQLGATHVLSVSACGSLRETIAPGHVAVVRQFVDWTRGKRRLSFFGDGLVAHVATAQPVSPSLAALVRTQAEAAQLTVHDDVTYVCIEGPRLGTQAESRLFQQIGCDVVGMTNVPEVFLAREAQLAYCTLAVCTDYDAWQTDPAHHVTVEQIIAGYMANIATLQRVIRAMAVTALPEREAMVVNALHNAIMTPPTAFTDTHRGIIDVLRQ